MHPVRRCPVSNGKVIKIGSDMKIFSVMDVFKNTGRAQIPLK